MNLIHIQGFLLGAARVLVATRRYAKWRPAMQGWANEQERQLRILLVLFKQVGGEYSWLHRAMLELAEVVGWVGGFALAFLPIKIMRVMLKQVDQTLILGLERAGHQIAIADWAGWEAQPSINPPKALLELAVARREWPSRWEGHVQFL